eukprot:TRINITY_DN2364_c0_g1_i2.p1 TRINITY_DN2364_c0_g1~~TRINITY_DN2364_c0_g1_i2.p1  ORF type:complete len:1768 (+),score=313.28 TRINITY_DN2364_c0_g1_i2:313-5616(+)
MQSGTIIRHIYIILALSFCTYITKAQHGIGTSIPDASTVLDISSANKGVLLPRVALTGTGDITTIANAATSLLVYNTATAGTGGTSVSPGYYYWTGTLWQRISGDNLGNHIATQNIELGGNYLSNDGGNEGIFVATDGKVGIGTNTPASTLNVSTGVDASLSAHGFFMLGNTSGQNLVLDDNEILARNNGAASTLYLQSDGGDFKVHHAMAAGNQFIVKEDGKVGIGTASPGTKLEVAGQVKITGGSPGANKVLTSDASGLASWQNTQGDNLGNHTATQNIQLSGNYLSNDGGNEGIFVATDGKVGIGTNTPDRELHINDGVFRMDRTSNSASFFFHRKQSDGTALKTFLFGMDASGVNNGSFFISDNGTAIGGASTKRLLIDNTGNVGLGTTTPLAKLHSGTTISDYSALDFSTTGAIISATSGDQDDAESNVLTLMRDGTSGVIYAGAARFDMSQWENSGTGARTKLDIKLANSATDDLASVLTMQSNGNVGIGSTSPGAKLHVAGNVKIDGNNTLEFGAGIAGKETNAGKIGYQAWSSDALDFVGAGTGSNRKMRFYAEDGAGFNGNLGVGTFAPSARLEVAGQVKITGGTPGANKVLTSDANGLASWQAAQGDNLGNHTATQNIQLGGNYLSNDGGNEGIFVATNGNIGVGNNAPSSKLHIAGDVKIDGNNTLEFGAGIAGKETNAGKIGYQVWSTDALDFVGAGTGSNRKMRFYAEDGAGFNGNLGVGTFTPGARLEVAGQVKITGGTPGVNKVLTSDANGLATWQNTQTDNLGNHTATQNIKLSGNYLSNDGGNEGIFVSTSGNVGIGFNAPTRPLDIQTNATTRNSLNLKRADNLYENGISFQNSGTWYEWNIYQSGGASSNFHIAGGSGVDDITTLPTRLSILSGGNVGIGTTTPGAKLEVTGQVKITGGTPGANKVLTSDANGLASWQTASGDNLGNHTATQNIKLSGNYLSNDGGNEGIHIDNSGNVGIGNAANSSAKLKVTGNNYFNTSGTSATTTNNTYVNGHIYFVPMDADNVSYIQSRRSNTSGDASMRLRTTNNGSLVEAVDISKEGNVAIGATSAGAKLDVNGQIKIRGGSPGVNKVLTSDANGLATWQSQSGDNLGNHAATQDIILGTHKIKGAGATPFEISESHLRFANNQNADSQIRSWGNLALWANDDNGGTEHMIFKVGGTGTGTERMRLNASGNLGIGTSTPLAKLHTGTTISDYATLNFSTTGAIISATSGDQNDAESNVLTLMRDGTSGVIYAGAARFDMSQWENSGTNARTKLDIKLANSSTSDLTSVLTMQSNGNVGIGTTSPGAKLDVNGQIKIRGGSPGLNKVLTSDVNGLATWQTASGDNFGNHTATTNIQLGGHYLSNDGGNEGVAVDNNGNVGIGTTSPGAKLEVAGQLKITGGTPGDGKVLISDANGLASWQDYTTLSNTIVETTGYVPDMNTTSQNGFTASTSNDYPAYASFPGTNVFDIGDYYYSHNINWSTPPIFQIHLDKGIKIKKYYIRGGLSNINYVPYDWTVEGSNDGSSWATIDSQNNYNENSVKAGVTIELNNITESYSYYRLKVTESYGKASVGATMLGFYDFQIYQAYEENSLQGLASVLRAGEDGDANRIINVSQVGINTSSPTATLSVNGDANKTGSTAWGTFSDIRLKDIQGNYTKGLQDISALHTVMYKYKRNNSLGWNSEQQQYGLIAQEVQHIFPEAVTTDNNGYLKLDVHPINMAVYNAIRELNEKVKTLEEENKRLRKDSERIKILEEKLEQLLNK